ncbi:MAG: hypothetical protein AB8G11_02390 [Saprospiraceae bacterium]
MNVQLPNGDVIVRHEGVKPIEDTTPVVAGNNNFVDYFAEYAKKNNYEVDPESLKIENEDELFDKIFEVKHQQKYGKDNQILKLAENNVDISSLATKIAEYDGLLANDDREFYYQAKALETANAFQAQNPNATNEVIQQTYNNSYNQLKTQHEKTDDSLFGDLANPYRNKYKTERDSIIPKTIDRNQSLKQERLNTFKKSQQGLIESAINNPSFLEKGDNEFKTFLEEKTSIDGNEIKFLKEIGSDPKKLSKMLELYYLDNKGRLSEAVGKRVLGNPSVKSPLFNLQSSGGGTKYIDTSKPH